MGGVRVNGSRRWALAAEDMLFTLLGRQRDFLCVATPGAGKTRFAGAVARRMLDHARVRRLVVVVPSTHLRKQWANTLSQHFHIELDYLFENAAGSEDESYDGVVVTYHQVAASPDLHRKLCANVPTLVIFDEIHHVGDENSWGSAVLSAFERSFFRLLLSGTPFRQDNRPIPFVRYKDNRSVADFTYSYGEAVSDTDPVCRDLYFRSLETRAVWNFRGKEYDHNFSDQLREELAAQRLRTVLDPGNEWLGTALQLAHDRLTEIRRHGHASAGGLVFAMNRWHALAIAKLLQKIAGMVPVVVESQDPDASDKLTAFITSDAPWLVAIRMVSEGVDIPRLRVGVFATNISTELFFRQAVGRFVRWQPQLGDGQDAYIFFPAEPVLLQYAEEIKQERDHVLKEALEEAKREGESAARTEEDVPAGAPFTPLSADLTEHLAFYDGAGYAAQELRQAEEHCREVGFRLEDAGKVAKLLRIFRSRAAHAEPPRQEEPESGPHLNLRDQRDRLAKALDKASKRLCEKLLWDHRQFNAQLNAYMKVARRQEATIAHLKLGILEVQRLMEEHGVSL